MGVRAWPKRYFRGHCVYSLRPPDFQAYTTAICPLRRLWRGFVILGPSASRKTALGFGVAEEVGFLGAVLLGDFGV